MDIDDVLKFLQEHNVRSITIDYDTDEATITERYGAVTNFEISVDNLCPDCYCNPCECESCTDCAEDPCSCAECTYCGSRPCVC